jgi:hypothetical protein
MFKGMEEQNNQYLSECNAFAIKHTIHLGGVFFSIDFGEIDFCSIECHQR